MVDLLESLTLVYGIADQFPDSAKAFRQLQLQDVMEIPCCKPDVEQLISIGVTVEIKKAHIINTPCGQSCEGQILTGRKLIIEGELHQKLEYVADQENQPIHAAHFCIRFSSFIVLGKEIECFSDFNVTGYVEDVYVKQLDKRRVFKNVLLLLNAVPCPNL
jgi:hypothetical protein